MGNFFGRPQRRKNFYSGIDTMELLESNYNGRDNPTADLAKTIDETKSELSNTNNVIKYIEENTSENIKLLSNDIYSINEEVSKLKNELSEITSQLEQSTQINRILANKVSNNFTDNLIDLPS